jgi:phytoene synthase
MQAEIHSWERSLLTLAQEAHLSHTHHDAPAVEMQLLDAAYGYCDDLTARNSRSFHMASSLLPLEKRRAVRALYAFCRVTDDIVDRPQSPDRGQALEAWRRTLHQSPAPANDLVAVAWCDARRRFHVPVRYAEQLLDGVARDLHQVRYETFADLAAYSYGVASTVGLMSMHIIGFKGQEAVPYAIKLGVALQMTNILRDVGEDWRNGRLYLPQEDMESFGVTENDIETGVRTGTVTPAYRNLIRFQIERNRRLYAEAWPGIGLLARDGRFAIGAAADLYRAILRDIERAGYNNFTRRAHVSTPGKLGMLPSIWWRSRRADAPMM